MTDADRLRSVLEHYVTYGAAHGDHGDPQRICRAIRDEFGLLPGPDANKYVTLTNPLRALSLAQAIVDVAEADDD